MYVPPLLFPGCMLGSWRDSGHCRDPTWRWGLSAQAEWGAEGLCCPAERGGLGREGAAKRGIGVRAREGSP